MPTKQRRPATKTNAPLLKRACRVLDVELEGIRTVRRRLDSSFTNAVSLLGKCSGRIAVIGVGKSGIIARKIAATLASTGTPAFFVHPTEALHGDAGMFVKEDCVLALSYSGASRELTELLPLIKRMGLKFIFMTGQPESRLARNADVVLNTRVTHEACPHDIIPTASTTAMLALGDALAICLLQQKGFSTEDFARLHPGGSIGKRLLLKVKDIMHQGKENPVVGQWVTVREALFVMTSARLGATSVVNKQGKLVGYFTDGDLRRRLEQGSGILQSQIETVMTRHPTTISPDELAVKAAELIRRKNFDNIPVIDKKGRPIGIVDERDLLAQGLK